MRILLDIGIPIKCEERAETIVIGELKQFFRAGGIVTWDFWRSLSTTEKACAVLAREALESEAIEALRPTLEMDHAELARRALAEIGEESAT